VGGWPFLGAGRFLRLAPARLSFTMWEVLAVAYRAAVFPVDPGSVPMYIRLLFASVYVETNGDKSPWEHVAQ